MFDNFNVNLRKNKGFLSYIPYIPISEYGQSNAPWMTLLSIRPPSLEMTVFQSIKTLPHSLNKIRIASFYKVIKCIITYLDSWLIQDHLESWISTVYENFTNYLERLVPHSPPPPAFSMT